MALALNRYLSTSVLPILTTYSHFFRDADHASALLDSLLHTVYRLSKCKSLTKNQRDTVSDFLVSFTRSVLTPPRSGCVSIASSMERQMMFSKELVVLPVPNLNV